MDSGVYILNLSKSRKVLSLLRSITDLHLCEAWVQETGDCKTRESQIRFSTLSIVFLTEETGYKRSELILLKGLVT